MSVLGVLLTLAATAVTGALLWSLVPRPKRDLEALRSIRSQGGPQ